MVEPMLSLQLTITKSYEKLKTRRFAEHVRASLAVAAKLWNDEFLPLHFQAGAQQRYHYVARAKSTWARKLARARKTGQQPLALVEGGEFRAAALTPVAEKKVITAATASRQRVRVRLNVPHRIPVKNQGEGTRLVNAELRAMQRVAAADLAQRTKADLRTKGDRVVYGRRGV